VGVLLRVKERLAKQYGGKPEEWQKKVSKVKSDINIFLISIG